MKNLIETEKWDLSPLENVALNGTKDLTPDVLKKLFADLFTDEEAETEKYDLSPLENVALNGTKDLTPDILEKLITDEKAKRKAMLKAFGKEEIN